MLFSVPGIYVSVDPNRSEIRYFWSWSALFRYNSKSVNRPSLSKISILCSEAGPVGSPRPRPISNHALIHAVQLKIKKKWNFLSKVYEISNNFTVDKWRNKTCQVQSIAVRRKFLRTLWEQLLKGFERCGERVCDIRLHCM